MPEVDIRVSPSNRVMDFARDAIDLAIRHSAGRHDGLTSEKLFDDKIMPGLYIINGGRSAFIRLVFATKHV
jgi:DNA-binding transcriptional LysR family regulator